MFATEHELCYKYVEGLMNDCCAFSSSNKIMYIWFIQGLTIKMSTHIEHNETFVNIDRKAVKLMVRNTYHISTFFVTKVFCR